MTRRSAWEELVAAGESARREAVRRVPQLRDAPLLAIGLATVDLDRAAVQLDAALGGPGGWDPRERDSLLGATSRIRTTSSGGPAVLLLEPDTEGLLAATLARHGEGIAAIYLAGPRPASNRPRLPLSKPGAGPLGSARRLLGGPADGPYVMLLDSSLDELPAT